MGGLEIQRLTFLCVRLRLYGLWVRSQFPNNGSNDDLMR